MSRNELAQSGAMSNEGTRVTERRERLKLNKSELAKESGVHRDTITDIENGKGFQAATMGKIDETLTRLEQEAGLDVPQATSGLVRYSVEGVYGAKALVVEGPVANIAELEASVDRIMRRIQGRGEGETESP
jgi:DNA-binding XRE family transcriptional regulator